MYTRFCPPLCLVLIAFTKKADKRAAKLQRASRNGAVESTSARSADGTDAVAIEVTMADGDDGDDDAVDGGASSAGFTLNASGSTAQRELIER